MSNNGQYPSVTCLCPTYGRFQKLRRALACFLAQDYPGEKHLLIFNDASVQLSPLPPGEGEGEAIEVVNAFCYLDNLGAKRQALIEAAETPLVAHWDDDDVYLPWHLSDCVAALGRGIECTKVRCAWVLEEHPLRITGRHCQGNDASMVFSRRTALAHGGYARAQVRQSIGLLEKFKDAGRYAHVKQGQLLSFVRGGRPHAPGHNLSARTAAAFRAANTDFGDGEPLTPAKLRPLWDTIIRGTYRRISRPANAKFMRRLEKSLEVTNERS